MTEIIGNILKFVLLCGIIVGIVGTLSVKSCWDSTDEWATKNHEAMYGDGGIRDQQEGPQVQQLQQQMPTKTSVMPVRRHHH